MRTKHRGGGIAGVVLLARSDGKCCLVIELKRGNLPKKDLHPQHCFCILSITNIPIQASGAREKTINKQRQAKGRYSSPARTFLQA